MLDQEYITSKIQYLRPLKLELGCGPSKSDPNSIGIDLLDYHGVDIVGDVLQVLRLMPEESVDSVYTSHFLEHLESPSEVIAELARVMKLDSSLTIIVPHFSNPYYYSDVTHKTPFGLYSLCYFALQPSDWRRRVPTYQRELHFCLDTVELRFLSATSFFLRRALKRIISLIVNFNSYTKEIYEECFCYLLPCYEIRYVLRKIH